MNLKQLEAFVKVAESGSFSKAAKDLYLTQPTVSAHIQSLEKELQARLFVRNTKEVLMSEEGQVLYKYAKQIFELEYQILEHFDIRRKDKVKHCITIAASTIPSQYLLPDILMKFQAEYPDEQFKLIETDSAGVVARIVDGTADVGFTGTVLEKSHCKFIPFYKDHLAVFTSNTKKYQEYKKQDTRLSWIVDEPVIMREEGSGTRKEAEKQLKKLGIYPKDLDIIASVDSQETIKRSVRQGMGISMLSRLAIKEEVERGYLLEFEIPGANEGRDINLVYNKNSKVSKNIERFEKIISELYGVQ